jgi:hypothetical protein
VSCESISSCWFLCLRSGFIIMQRAVSIPFGVKRVVGNLSWPFRCSPVSHTHRSKDACLGMIPLSHGDRHATGVSAGRVMRRQADDTACPGQPYRTHGTKMPLIFSRSHRTESCTLYRVSSRIPGRAVLCTPALSFSVGSYFKAQH